MADLSDTIQAVDYAVFASVLIASLAIGIYYGFFGKKNKTNEEFLMAGRSMSILPVSLSLLCSFLSAISLLGKPAEIYFYGLPYTLIVLAFIPITFALVYIYVPVYFDLQLTSAFEYLEWRFSRKVRFVVSIFAMIQLIFYMPTTVLGPSLALDQVAGINYQLSSALIFIVCVLYSSIGGLKAVLWTDAFQAFVMFLSLGMIIGLGIKEIGGISLIWEIAAQGDRTTWFNFDTDLRTRHTFWSNVIGGYCIWLSFFAGTQSQIQRYNSVPTFKQATLTIWFSMAAMTVAFCLCSLLGLMIFAEFVDCDPVASKAVKSSDQLLPYFVLSVLGKYSGIPGLFVAGLTCGTLSTVSSALNSITLLIVEDFVKQYFHGLSEERLGWISKCISTGIGCVAFGLIFLIAEVNQTVPIIPFTSLFQGTILGPTVAVFSLGIMYPWANDMGTFLGMLAGSGFTAFVGIGSIMQSRSSRSLPIQKLNITTMGCEFTNSTQIGQDYYYGNWKELHSEDSVLVKIFSLSFTWQSACGVLSTTLCGIIFSAIFSILNRNKLQKKVNIKLLSKPVIKLWIYLFGQKRVEKCVDFIEFDFQKKHVSKKLSKIVETSKMEDKTDKGQSAGYDKNLLNGYSLSQTYI